ncbi:hypothetical protein [Mesobacillus maritimus]|uniref:hypothetical protein n=1 Tax=Mesobacillus maritimus TaxID=1643336 RepID=UPI00384C5947
MIEIKIEGKIYMVIDQVQQTSAIIDCFGREIKEFTFLKLDNPMKNVTFKIKYKKLSSHSYWRIEHLSYYNNSNQKYKKVPEQIAGLMGENLTRYLLNNKEVV